MAITATSYQIAPTGNESLEKQGTYSYETGTNLLTEITGEDPKVFDYDNNANTIQENNRVYVYNASDQLITVSDGSTQIAQYVYNGSGQRIKKILPAETRIFHYDLAGHIIAETNQSGQMLAEYIYLQDQLLAMIRPGENVYYYHNDHLGTPQILTDGNGNLAWKASYIPFGNADVLFATVENPFRFPGQYYDQETGLHYNYFRYYDPTTGRYATPDPIGLGDGVNLWPYVENGPLSYTDPWGLVRIKIAGKIYEYRLTDHHGVNPPEVHVHDLETGQKVGAETGNIYDAKGKQVCGKLSTKSLSRLQKVLRGLGYLGVALAAYQTYESITADDAQALENLLNMLNPIPADRRERMFQEIIKNNPDKFIEIIEQEKKK